YGLGTAAVLDELVAHVAEEPTQPDLLVRAAERPGDVLTDDRHNRFAVELGVVEAVEQLHRAGPLGGEADPDAAGELGVPGGHERGGLLVPGGDERRLAAGAVQRLDQRGDRLA